MLSRVHGHCTICQQDSAISLSHNVALRAHYFNNNTLNAHFLGRRKADDIFDNKLLVCAAHLCVDALVYWMKRTTGLGTVM